MKHRPGIDISFLCRSLSINHDDIVDLEHFLRLDSAAAIAVSNAVTKGSSYVFSISRLGKLVWQSVRSIHNTGPGACERPFEADVRK
jgi:hypothetical protein